MKKEISLMVIASLLWAGISYAGLFGKSDKEVEEEIKKRESVLTASFNETLALKEKEISQKNTEIEKLKIENVRLSAEIEETKKNLEETKKNLEETNKTIEEIQKRSAPLTPSREIIGETRPFEEIITTEITKYAEVIPSSGGLKIVFGTDFFFYFDVLEPPVFRSLDTIVKALKAYPEHRILITGYTDSVGNKNTNLKTSLVKAKAIANYLIAKGIPEEKMIIKGLGPAGPIDTNKTKEGRKKNRRVEVVIK